MDITLINEMRSFNRFYTAVIGVLNKKFLNSKYSLPESRVLQTINLQSGITASEIIVQLNMDKSYLSRIILQFERKKLLVKKTSDKDGRVVHLYLTAYGKKEFAVQDKASHNQVKQLLERLQPKEQQKLIGCMQQIKDILSGPGMPAA
ncbi:MAG: MarR family winged helix-turn-helix transcriptional regulator [Chitinophagaceae bacterium]